jgi:predicted protein tyrosine phosphatase
MALIMDKKLELPYAESYWVIPGKLIAGEYPGSNDEEKTIKRVQSLLRHGVQMIVDLTQPGDRFNPYSSLLYHEAHEYGIDVTWKNLPILDFSVPTDSQMVKILDEIDHALNEGKITYVHCVAGIGRTGLVVGCYLIRHGYPPEQVLDQIASLRKDMPTWWRTSPEAVEQVEFIQKWQYGR